MKKCLHGEESMEYGIGISIGAGDERPILVADKYCTVCKKFVDEVDISEYEVNGPAAKAMFEYGKLLIHEQKLEARRKKARRNAKKVR